MLTVPVKVFQKDEPPMLAERLLGAGRFAGRFVGVRGAKWVPPAARSPVLFGSAGLIKKKKIVN